MLGISRTMNAQLSADPERLSFVHFGDLHIRTASNENYGDLQDLIAEVNGLAGRPDFVFLPGDNADVVRSDISVSAQVWDRETVRSVVLLAGPNENGTKGPWPSWKKAKFLR